MKKILAVIVVVVIGYAAYAAMGTTGTQGSELNLLIWDNYMAEDTVSNFEEQTGASVVVELFKNNEEALAKVKANPGVYDVVVPSDYMVAIMKEENLLETLDHSMIPNLSNLAPSAKGHYFDPDLSVSVPYAFGSTGFAVNTSFTQDTDISWEKLKDPKYKGHIVIMDDMRYVLGSVLLELGLDPNTTDKADLDKAVALLKEVLPNVQKITPDTPVDLMIGEGAWIAYGYSGDSYQMQDGNENITYMLPSYGSMQFYDNLVIPQGAPHKELAHKFLNYILEPQVSADLVNATSFGNPNTAALELIDESVVNNPSVFPPANVLSKLHFVKDVGDDVALYDEAWLDIKSN